MSATEMKQPRTTRKQQTKKEQRIDANERDARGATWQDGVRFPAEYATWPTCPRAGGRPSWPSCDQVDPRSGQVARVNDVFSKVRRRGTRSVCVSPEPAELRPRTEGLPTATKSAS